MAVINKTSPSQVWKFQSICSNWMWHDFISYWMCRSLYCYIENSQRLRRLIQNQQVFIALCLSKSKVQSLYRHSSSRGLILFLLPVRILHASSHSLWDFSFYYRLLFFSEIYNQMILWVHSEVTYDLYISRLYIYIAFWLTLGGLLGWFGSNLPHLND